MRYNNSNLVKHRYNTEEITKIFINMNFLKKFDLPDNIKENFVKEVFNQNAKKQLDQFKKNVQTRIRSNTVKNASFKKSNILHIFIYFIKIINY